MARKRRNPRKPRYSRERKQATPSEQLAADTATYPWGKSKVHGDLVVYLVNTGAALWVKNALELEKGTEERQALEDGNLEFGVLENFSASDVIAFGRNVSLAGENTYPFPTKIVGKKGTQITLLAAAGSPDDLHGESLYPLGDNNYLGDSSLAGILANVLLFGLWSDGEWKGEVSFVLPTLQERESDKGDAYDSTKVPQLMRYLCGKNNDSCPTPRFVEDLLGAISLLGRLPALGPKGKLGRYLWKTDRERKETLDLLAATLPEMRIGYISEKETPRSISPEEYYGSESELRYLATLRKRVRVTMSEGYQVKDAKKAQPTPLTFDQLAEKRPEEKEFINAIRQSLTVKNFLELSPKEQKKLEKQLWDATNAFAVRAPREEKQKEKFGFPIFSRQKTPIKSIMFTLYWGDPEEEDPLYKIMSQSVALSPTEMRELAQEVLNEVDPNDPPKDKKGVPYVLNPLAALRAGVLRKMGMIALKREWKEVGKPPFQPRLLYAISGNRQAFISGRHYGAPKPLTATPSVGMYFGEIKLGSWDSPWTKPGAYTTLVPSAIAQSSFHAVASSLMNVTTKKGSTTLVRQRDEPATLFSAKNIAQSSNYRWWTTDEKSPLVKKYQEGKLTPEELKRQAYVRIINGMSGSFGGKTTETILGGRRGFTTVGGKKKVASSKRGKREWATKSIASRKSIFSFVTSLCKEKDVTCAKETRVADRFSATDFESEMFRRQIEGHADDIDSLKELRESIRQELTGDFYEQAAEGILYDGGAGEEILSSPMLDALALPNGRRRRPPRRPRRPRRGRRSRRNPITDSQSLLDYEKYGPGQEGQREVAARTELGKLRRESPPQNWEVTKQAVDSYFPRGPAPINRWELGKTLGAAKATNLLARLRDLPPDESYLADLQEGSMPFTMQAPAQRTGEAAELSLRETAGMVAKQKQRRKSQLTMQASSALCMNGRTRKLDYRLPGRMPGVDKRRDVIIWISPKGDLPRVMTTRRGVHLDCDFTGEREIDLPDLLGNAIQSTMYWLAQKPKRINKTKVWVGRVGVPEIALAWDEKDTVEGVPFTVANVMKHLRDPSRRTIMAKPDVNADKKNYEAAVSHLFGKRTPVTFKPPPPPPSPVEEDDEKILTLLEDPEGM
jgi:hypothetical protein